ncbi:MAG: hypothetical protein U1F76_07670 [Candidatus Competibacteraceae bacterium]
MEKRIDLNASDLSQQHFWNTTLTRSETHHRQAVLKTTDGFRCALPILLLSIVGWAACLPTQVVWKAA